MRSMWESCGRVTLTRRSCRGNVLGVGARCVASPLPGKVLEFVSKLIGKDQADVQG